MRYLSSVALAVITVVAVVTAYVFYNAGYHAGWGSAVHRAVACQGTEMTVPTNSCP